MNKVELLYLSYYELSTYAADLILVVFIHKTPKTQQV